MLFLFPQLLYNQLVALHYEWNCACVVTAELVEESCVPSGHFYCC